MIPFDDAISKIYEIAKPLPAINCEFAACHGQTLARDLNARSNAPYSDVSAMDGYGVRDSQLKSLPAHLPILKESFAGSPPNQTAPEDGCVRIFTGAPVPAGIDRVIIQENVERDGDTAIFNSPPTGNTNIRKLGSDFKAGDTLLKVGTLLNWRAMTTAAAADQSQLYVTPTPNIVILATGDELMPPGQAHKKAGAIPESVSYGVSSFATEVGANIVRSESLRDALDELKVAAEKALKDADIIVVTGGASVGERDYAKSMFEEFGLDIVFSKVAMKPGKPVWCAKAKNTIILGLPGNPSSALVTARLFLKPLILGLSGRDAKVGSEPNKLPLAKDLPSNGSRENFIRGYLNDGKVHTFSSQDSSLQSTLANADLLIRRPPNAPAAAIGDLVPAYDF